MANFEALNTELSTQKRTRRDLGAPTGLKYSVHNLVSDSFYSETDALVRLTLLNESANFKVATLIQKGSRPGAGHVDQMNWLFALPTTAST